MNLIDLLPAFYAGSAEVKDIQGALQFWSDTVRSDRDDLMAQLNVLTATWGLNSWEKALGIETDSSRPLDFRRTRVMSKLRGSGTTTAPMIEGIAKAFSNGEVEIIEHNGGYRFEIKFTGVRGVPPNMDDLSSAIEEIKPAHLAYSFIFTYITWDDIEAYNHTWNEWEACNLTWDNFETYKE